MTDTTDINNTSAYDGANASAAVDANLVAVLYPFVGHGITGDERIGSAL